MIDWTKPIEYIDGSPAKFLERTRDGYAVVTPKGQPNAHTGNYYRDDGTHISAYYPSIRNVDPIVADILHQFGFILDAQTTRNGDQDARVIAVAHLLKGE